MSKPKVEKYDKQVEAKIAAPSDKKEEDDFEPYYSDEEPGPKKDFRAPRASTVEVHRPQEMSTTPAKETPKKPVEEELTKE